MFDLDGTLLPFVQDEFVKLYFKGLCTKLAPLGYDPNKLVKVVCAARKFLSKGDRVKITLRFRGREMAHMANSKHILELSVGGFRI